MSRSFPLNLCFSFSFGLSTARSAWGEDYLYHFLLLLVEGVGGDVLVVNGSLEIIEPFQFRPARGRLLIPNLQILFLLSERCCTV